MWPAAVNDLTAVMATGHLPHAIPFCRGCTIAMNAPAVVLRQYSRFGADWA